MNFHPLTENTSVLHSSQKTKNIGFDQILKDYFGDDLIFAFIYEDPRDSKKKMCICVKNSDETIEYTELHQALLLKSQNFSEFLLIKLSILRERIEYLAYIKPSSSITNERVYEGLALCEILLSHAIEFYGNEMAYKKYVELAKEILNSWESSLRIQSDKKNVSIFSYITYARPTDDIQLNALALHDTLSQKKDEIAEILIECEPYEVAMDEINGALQTLSKIHYQLHDLRYIKGKLTNVSIFLPINLPLYSFILYAVIIGLSAEQVFVRCPVTMRGILKKILSVLQFENIFPHIHLLHVEREVFRKQYVSQSEMIIFTGKYENATDLLNQYTDTLFIYNGYGVNPIVIAKDANTKHAAEKTVNMRIYNSGQDCGAPDAILVHTNIYDTFITNLKEQLNAIQIGDFHDPKNRIGKMLNKENVLSVIEKVNNKKVIYGGLLNFASGIVYPTIIESQISDFNYQEYFAPIFNIVKYSNDTDLETFFSHKSYIASAMYVSLFGTETYIEKLNDSIVLKEKILLDIDNGYSDFGGYGKKTNFIFFKGKKESFPILISRDVAQYLKQIMNHVPLL